MCGITGWVDFGHDLTIRHDVLAAMTATLLPRGPDAGGLWTSEHAALGNRRLAVLDPANGTQPMSAGHVTITYNGEVFNFQELRADLRGRGHRFTTGTDTEVVLRGYLEWGLGVAERLNGMFAFALWDGRAQRLVLVRDRLGVKPLYYYPTGNGVLFGSEPKAVFAHPGTRREIDADGLRELFTHTPGHTVYKGLHEVRPGTILTADRTGTREHFYWRLETAPHLDDAEETAKEIRRLRQDIVARQLVADVPIGRLAAPFGERSTVLRRELVTIRDLPQSAGDMDFPLLQLFRAAREHFTVVLPEEGADHLFGGHRPMSSTFFREDVVKTLDLEVHAADTYASAVNEIARLPGETEDEWQQRKAAYLHLTRTIKVMLDRADRLSMAVGLEVRLPFTDHRLVEYLYNARQPSATSVRTDGTLAALRTRTEELTSDHPVFELVDRSRVAGHLDQVLDLAAWLEVHQPHLKL
ncbi:asparagine synthase-related protein [Lentzea sp. NPDC005914]|uniref:asparagine synthetase B family protein n=1 Tax=Lentzea sp. NPDC005914 TaxID=3154572 RepID=UPI0033EDFE8E